jgi:hypothetical protein
MYIGDFQDLHSRWREIDYQNLILDTNILCLKSFLQEGAYNHNALNVEPCSVFFINLNFHVKPKVAISDKRM